VKLAILMALTGMSAAEGEISLRNADGFLRRAAAQHQPRAAI
jgi:N-acetylmuramic acid 6-phosphate etherase